MKKTFLLLFLSLNLSLNLLAQNAFEVMTKKPTPGSTVAIEYMPRNTVLQGVKDFAATAYLIEGAMPRALEVPLKQEGGVYRGSVKTADSTKAVFFAFAKDDKQDNNNDEGYYTPLFTKSGNEVPGAKLAIGSAFSSFGGIWGLKRNPAKGAELTKQEFADAAMKEKFANEYLSFLGQSKEESDKETLKAELEKLSAKKDLSEADYGKLKTYYERFLKDKEKAAAVTAQMKERYPDGAWKRGELVNAFFAAKDLKAKEEAYSQYSSLTPLGKPEQQNLAMMAGQLATMYANTGDNASAKKYLAVMPDNAGKANTLNSIAWKLSGEGLTKKPGDVKTGLELSKQSLALMEKEKKAMADKPSYYTAAQYAGNLDDSYHMFADTYATLLYHNADYAQAYAIEKAAVEHNKRKDASMNEAYVILIEKVKGPKAAQAELEKFLEEGKYTPAMKEQLKGLYTADGKTESDWNAYVTNLEEAAYNKLKVELAKKMINMPAPQFALKNMAGEKVELASLKGKVVVVDFWATWCGPCIASFPGMQMAVNKFKNNPNVAFVFIDTWENDSNRVQKVTDFIAKNKYSFNVLYDEAKAKEGNEFTVVQDFKVDGIPTKFVIDKASNIRFKSVGFGGSADGIVSELSAMIDMAGAESGEPVKKGF